MIAGLELAQPELLLSGMYNCLQAAAEAVLPEISELRTLLENAGALAALVSGSGSAVFALAADYEDALKMKNTAKEQGYWSEVARFRNT